MIYSFLASEGKGLDSEARQAQRWSSMELREPALPMSTAGLKHVSPGAIQTHTHTHTQGNNKVSSALANTQENDHREPPPPAPQNPSTLHTNKMSTTAVPPPAVILKDKK